MYFGLRGERCSFSWSGVACPRVGLKILHCLAELMCCRCYRSKYYYLFLIFARYYFMN